jgi:hypothetical protein
MFINAIYVYLRFLKMLLKLSNYILSDLYGTVKEYEPIKP